MGSEGLTVGEKEVTEHLPKYLGVSLQSPVVKQIAVKVSVFCGLFKHHTVEDAEFSHYQNTNPFHAFDDEKAHREVVVQPDLVALIFVQLDDRAEEI